MVERSRPHQTGLSVAASEGFRRALGVAVAGPGGPGDHADQGRQQTGKDQEVRPDETGNGRGPRGGRAPGARRRWIAALWGGGSAICRAAGRWKLLGQQQCDLGGQRWRQARTSRRWTWATEACVRWVAGWGGDDQGDWSGPLPGDPGCGQPHPTVEGLTAGTFSDRFLVALSLATKTAQEAEGHFEVVCSRAAVVCAAMEELASSTPGLFEDELVRGLSRGAARECRLRAELLVEEARASLEVLAEAAAELRDSAVFVEDLRFECADAMTRVWRLRGDGHDEPEAGCFAAGDLIAAVAAGLAAATSEMDRWARRELDLAGWHIFAGLRRLRQAQREERCAGRVWRMWLEDEAGWWQVLAAAAEATMADGRVGLAADGGEAGGDSSRGAGGGDGGGPGGRGDGTPQPGQDHGEHDSNSRCSGHDGSEDRGGCGDGASGTGGGGDVTPPAGADRRIRGRQWTGEKGECWGTRTGAEGTRREAHGDRREDVAGGGSRSRRGNRCLRLRGWRRWLAGQAGPAGRRHPHGAVATLRRGRYTSGVAGLWEPRGAVAAPSSGVHDPCGPKLGGGEPRGSRSLTLPVGWAAFSGRHTRQLERTKWLQFVEIAAAPHTHFFITVRLCPG
jgi:hypothetical protein